MKETSLSFICTVKRLPVHPPKPHRLTGDRWVNRSADRRRGFVAYSRKIPHRTLPREHPLKGRQNGGKPSRKMSTPRLGWHPPLATQPPLKLPSENAEARECALIGGGGFSSAESAAHPRVSGGGRRAHPGRTPDRTAGARPAAKGREWG